MANGTKGYIIEHKPGTYLEHHHLTWFSLHDRIEDAWVFDASILEYLKRVVHDWDYKPTKAYEAIYMPGQGAVLTGKVIDLESEV